MGANLGPLRGLLGAISASWKGAIFEAVFHTPPGPVLEAIWVLPKVNFKSPERPVKGSEAQVHFDQKCTKTNRFL